MLAKYTLPFVLLSGAFVLACGDSGSGSSNGGTGGQGGTGGSTATAGSGGTGGTTANGGTSTGGMTTGGSGGTTSTTGTVTDCAPLGDACTNCLAEQCTALYCTCYGDPACIGLVQCSQGCAGDPNCNQGCFTNNQNGISEAALLSDCGAKNCAACPGTVALGTCELCVFTSCSAQMNTCLANPDCNDLVQCVQGGGDPLTCATLYPDGYNDASDLNDCTQANCAGSGC